MEAAGEGLPKQRTIRVLSAGSILSSDGTENYLFDTWPIAEALMTAVTTGSRVAASSGTCPFAVGTRVVSSNILGL